MSIIRVLGSELYDLSSVMTGHTVECGGDYMAKQAITMRLESVALAQSSDADRAAEGSLDNSNQVSH